MTKYLCFFIITCFIACGATVVKNNKAEEAQKNDTDKILWSPNRKLTWNDFKGVSKKDKGNKKAETFGEIITEKRYWENGVPKFEIRCYFLKNKSWTATNDSLTLEHEQIHFDIFEVYSRKIRKSFDSLNRKKVVDFIVYEKLFNKFLNQNQNCNDKYDDDVRFERFKQQKWIDKVSNELEELKGFEYIPEDE